jgi:hypothetical protein
MTFSEFAGEVEVKTHKRLEDVPHEHEPGSLIWRRENLEVELSESSGRALVSYRAKPSYGGHSSSGATFDLTSEGADRAADYIVAKLNDRYLYD